MKNISFLCAISFAVLLMSCSQENQNVQPSTRNSLSMVVVKPNGGTSLTNQLLLKDGRVANPQSGISNFSTMKAGSKLSITFREGSVQNGVVNIDVTNFESATDSVFVPAPLASNQDTTILSGVFTGVAYMSNADSTVNQTGTVSISFANSSYVCSGSSSGYPEQGNGTFIVANGKITFTDAHSESSSKLNGEFYFYLSSNGLYLWSVRNGGDYYSFSLKRD